MVGSEAMDLRRTVAALAILLAASSCSEEGGSSMARNPLSVRGWIEDVAGAKREQSPDIEIARRTQLFQATSVWIESAQFASGGVAENGSFIILDVPPGNTTISFNAPGAEQAKVILQNVPGNADVLIPEIILSNGGATVRNPKAIKVRVPGSVDKPRPTGQNAIIVGVTVPIMEVPVSQLVDRRDYPDPGGFRPVAIVR